MSITVFPWLMACAGAAWFGWIAFRTNRNWISSAITGALFALVITTFVFGLGQATAIPFSDNQRAGQQLLWALISAGILGAVGSLFTFWLWRKPLRSGLIGNDKTPIASRPEDKPKTLG